MESQELPVDQLWTVEDLSRFLRKEVWSIRSDLCRNPQSLPPFVNLPGTRRKLWRPQDAHSWVAQYVVQSRPVEVYAGNLTKKGRPTKKEVIERGGAK